MKRFLTYLALALTLVACSTTASAWPPVRGAYGGHGPVALVINPASQSVSRSGAGAISTGVTYTASGGQAPYTYTTTAPGLTITGGTTTTPTFSTTLTSGQDSFYTVTGTVTDSNSHSTPTTASIEFIATVPPAGLGLIVTPSAQTVSRSGAGAISAGVTYTASGGTPPYTYSTTAPGLSISGGTTTTPTLSTTLIDGQDTTYTVTGTLNDSAGTTPAVTPASVRFTASAAPFDPLVPLAKGMVADDISQTAIQAPSSNNSPYTPHVTATAAYRTADYTALGQGPGGAGFTYFRIPIDVQQVLPNPPFASSYFQKDNTGKYLPIPVNNTRTLGTTYVLPDGSTGALPGPSGCTATYISSACTVEYDLQYLDSTIAAMIAAGFAVDLVPFAGTGNSFPGPNCTATCPSGDLHTNMGTGANCYGYAVMPGATCFETMVEAANVALVNRYAAAYPGANQVFFELSNEPDYKVGGVGIQNPAYWNTALPIITAAIRAVPDTTHWLISDCISAAKAQNCHAMIPTSDGQTVYSIHKYDQAQMIAQTVPGGGQWKPYAIYPREGTGGAAIGRSGGVAPSYINYPVLSSSPVGNTVFIDASCPAALLDQSTTFITAITNANPGVVTTSKAHFLTTGAPAYIGSALGMSGVNGGPYVATKIDSTHFSFGVNTTASGAYTLPAVTGAVASGTDVVFTVSSDLRSQLSAGSLFHVTGVVTTGAKNKFNDGWTVVSITATTITASPTVPEVPAATDFGTYSSGGNLKGVMSGGPVWPTNNSTPLTGSGQKVACVNGNGTPTGTALIDFFTGDNDDQNIEGTKADLYSSTSNGINLAVTWAAAGGHDMTGGAPVVLTIIYGEIGATSQPDYRSRLQFMIDLRDTLDHTAVPGGQDHIPWDWWAYVSHTFGMRPKGPDTTQGHNCTGTVAGVAGMDLDTYAILATPQNLAGVPHCSGVVSTIDYGTPGY